MSEIVSAGFTNDTEGFQVQFVTNAAGDANLEMVTQGEQKMVDDYYEKVTVKSMRSVIDDLMLDVTSQTVINVGNADQVFMGVSHLLAGGTCKMIAVGFLDTTFYPLGEFSFTATALKTGEASWYYSHVQKIPCMGFSYLFFLISELSSGNAVTVQVWPVIPEEEPI